MNVEKLEEDLRSLFTELGVVGISEKGVRIFMSWYNIYHLLWLIKRFFIIFSYVAIVVLTFKTEFQLEVSTVFKLAFLAGVFFMYAAVFSILPYNEGQKVVKLAVKLIKYYPEHYILKEDEEDG